MVMPEEETKRWYASRYEFVFKSTVEEWKRSRLSKVLTILSIIVTLIGFFMVLPSNPVLGWSGRTKAIVALSCAVFVLLAIIEAIFRFHRRTSRGTQTLITRFANDLSEANFELSELDWFSGAVTRDRHKIERAIYVSDWSIREGYDSPTPFVEFRFRVFNGSLFTVAIGREIDGFINYSSSGNDMHLKEPVSLSHAWPVDELRRHTNGIVEIKQMLAPNEVTFIRDDLNSYSGEYRFDHLSIMITVDGHPEVEPRPMQFYCRGVRRNGSTS
jgi:hypothetical protein